MKRNKVKIIGAGLAGSEAAWQLAKRGIDVELWEMRPEKTTPAHTTSYFSELVCSNSLKSNALTNACGLLKEEMRRLDSLIIEAADNSSIPAGAALAVDRNKFAEYITDKISSCENISIVREEYTQTEIDDYTIIAGGPLASDSLCSALAGIEGGSFLNFFDASAPIVDAESIDYSKCFKGSRYSDGGDDYINCPLTKDEYYAFVEALISAETAQVHGFEQNMVFEGCMPVEVMAERGIDTLRFGPLKGSGFEFPDGTKPFALVQLRSENAQNSMYNMVGFQTHLKFGEQKRVFSMIPALENAVFLRYGVMHRNTYINSPTLLNKYYQMEKYPKVFFAGQITGVEGYVESASSGILAGYNMAAMLNGKDMFEPDSKTCIGALPLYISNSANTKFQPMNANFGIIDGLNERIRNKAERYNKIANRALDIMKDKLNNKYDFIYSVAVIHMFLKEEHRNLFYKFIYEHLNDTGIALVISMGDGTSTYKSNIDDAFKKVVRKNINTNKEIMVTSTSCNIVDFATFKEEIIRNNFKIIKCYISSDIPNFDKCICAIISK